MDFEDFLILTVIVLAVIIFVANKRRKSIPFNLEKYSGKDTRLIHDETLFFCFHQKFKYAANYLLGYVFLQIVKDREKDGKRLLSSFVSNESSLTIELLNFINTTKHKVGIISYPIHREGFDKLHMMVKECLQDNYYQNVKNQEMKLKDICDSYIINNNINRYDIMSDDFLFRHVNNFVVHTNRYSFYTEVQNKAPYMFFNRLHVLGLLDKNQLKSINEKYQNIISNLGRAMQRR